MKAYPLSFRPVFQERIWGGSRLREFGYSGASDGIGEAWVISDHDHGPTPVADGPLAGKRLSEVMRAYPEWFGLPPGARFPLLVKVIDASEDLSVQVHPDDRYARPRGDAGKTEAWFVLFAEPGASIVYGHRAQTREEFEKRMKEGAWGNLLVKVPVRAGDFFYVPSGTLHAIGRGLLILEIQQSSDTTYRVYDYDRVGADGRKRDLHVKEALAVTRCPSPKPQRPGYARSGRVGAVIEHLVRGEVFTIDHWRVDGEARLDESGVFRLINVIQGSGEMVWDHGRRPVAKGDHLLLPAVLHPVVLSGRFEALFSAPVISTRAK
ncbi:type I phosphomannose isomerase catalytic subunit [Kyrpidia tusciae]|uniref:Mannose-6-phosphate isomerase n=1 Tax=Kyrpidia tusciae (strain DSM 2912 / NBRC 15312 / T2) TaxID=562970 RepID=D5WUR0_KYRT2|nr:type I phosphomannose isomerase catalytic subunit [Kyrpidia tusciae]ADG05450.1 mannose-6-phosphate isomerase, class I [Kyrpidia tusciae DSM 2912]MBE3551583.1 class I mannose-6-phosphate isomerase [Kyrpidia tusciae]